MKIAPAAEGEEFALTIEITDEKGLRRENHCIAAQYFRETTLPSHIDAPYAADAELLSQIRYLSLCTAAIRAGLRLLEFSFNTKKNLRGKLIRKGFPPEAADAAVAFFSENGSRSSMHVHLNVRDSAWYLRKKRLQKAHF